MIGFELTEEQQHWQKKAQDFAEKEIKPLAWKIDRGLTQEFHWPLIKKISLTLYYRIHNSIYCNPSLVD